MSSHLSCRHKVDCYKYNNLCKAHGNLKVEIYSRYKKGEEKVI